MGTFDFFIIIAIGLLSAAGQYFFKKGLVAILPQIDSATDVIRIFSYAATNPRLWLAVATYVIAFGLYATVLIKSDVSQIFPAAIGINILCVAIMAMVMLGESVTVPRVVGMAAIAFGVCIVSRF